MNLRALDWQHVALFVVAASFFALLCVVAARYPSADLWPVVGSGATMFVTTILALLKPSPIEDAPRQVVIPPAPTETKETKP